jgi:drug/metabolite transporter (DMT)-like permease
MLAINWRLPKDGPLLNRTTLIGILVAVTGNVLISFALNLQKLAHRRLDASAKRKSPARSPTLNSDQPLAERQGVSTNDYHRQQTPDVPDYGTLPRPKPSPNPPPSVAATPGNFDEVELLGTSSQSKGVEDINESRYLKSKVWWLGFLLMNVGEAGNFISYAFAPASVVAPLGTFALISNCIFAPCMLGERFKKRDLFGVMIATAGAVTVVLSSNISDPKMNLDALRTAVTQPPFIIYSAVYAAGAMVLATLSHGKIGQKFVFVDVGLCALFGGFTVLSTKALSTLLTTEWVNIFAQWITYPILFILLATGVGQIRYLNRALMRFDSKIVIPIQFVLFTLSAIIGSAILYGDFRRASFHQTVTFLYGVVTTFVGVFTIAWDHSASEDLSVDDAETAVATSPENRLRVGRKRGLFAANSRDPPTLRKRRSRIDVIGLSPAKHLLLVEREQINDFDSEPELEGIIGSPDRRLLSTSRPFEC